MSVPNAGAAGKPAGGSAGMVDVEHVAELLNCSTRTIRRMVDEGRMPPPVRLTGGRRGLVRWNLATVEAWITGGCRPAARRGKGVAR